LEFLGLIMAIDNPVYYIIFIGLIVHLSGFVWWASRITSSIDYIRQTLTEVKDTVKDHAKAIMPRDEVKHELDHLWTEIRKIRNGKT